MDFKKLPFALTSADKEFSIEPVELLGVVMDFCEIVPKIVRVYKNGTRQNIDFGKKIRRVPYEET